MSDIKRFSPLWGEWELKELIGEGSFGSVYRAEKREYGNLYVSAVKHLSIPGKGMSAGELMAEGIIQNQQSAYRYYDSMRDQIINEINFCCTVKGNTHIVSYEDHCIIPKKDEYGYDIFIRMEYLVPLTKYMLYHEMTEDEVIQLGIDMTDALSVLNFHHMIHRDVKPANIFVNPMGIFKLGDFGESKVLSGKSTGITVRGTYSYMSPEIYSGKPADITADIYSLGMTMYRILNGHRPPFVQSLSASVSADMQNSSNTRRFSGERLPAPQRCSNPQLAGVILRACEYHRQNRYRSPEEFREALVQLKSMSLNDASYNLVKSVFGQQGGEPSVTKPTRPDTPGGSRDMPPDDSVPSRDSAVPIWMVLSIILIVLFVTMLILIVTVLGNMNSESPETSAVVITKESSPEESPGYPSVVSPMESSPEESPDKQTESEETERRYSGDPVNISASYYHTVGLKPDGTVIAAGTNNNGQCDVKAWKNMIAVSAGGSHTVGLRSDGTVEAVGDNGSGRCNVGSWKNIIAVSAGYDHTVGLKADGTVIAVGSNTNGQCEVSGWKDIVAVSAGSYYTVGLKSDGTVVATKIRGVDDQGQCDVGKWSNIAAVSAGYLHTVGIRTDGTVVSVGDNSKGQRNLSGWENIVSISARSYETVGIRADGTVAVAGRNDYGQKNGVSEWKDIIAAAPGSHHTVGIKKDGSVITAGSNEFGQSDVSGWKLKTD